jgi:hypothetical protein
MKKQWPFKGPLLEGQIEWEKRQILIWGDSEGRAGREMKQMSESINQINTYEGVRGEGGEDMEVCGRRIICATIPAFA